MVIAIVFPVLVEVTVVLLGSRQKGVYLAVSRLLVACQISHSIYTKNLTTRSEIHNDDQYVNSNQPINACFIQNHWQKASQMKYQSF